MSGELISLRILLAGAVAAHQELWCRAIAQASVPIEFEAVTASAAKVALKRGGVDICVLDAALGGADAASVIGSARTSRPVPLIFAGVPRDGARPDMVDGVLPVVADAIDARKAVDICVRAKMPTSVLLASGSESLRGIVRKILGASRFALNVHEAVDGVDTLERLGKGGFGLVFLDSDMPGFNGLDVMQGIKRMRPDVTVVLMSSTFAGRPQPSDPLVFLKKPFYPDDVDAVLQRYFGLKDPQ